MLEVMQFIFSSFWIWLGTVILVNSIAFGFHGLLFVLRGDKNND